jgi:hypothetical protein
MVKLREAENRIVIDFEVYDRRPSDSDLLVPPIDAHQAAVGRVPYLLAADAAFYSRKNEAATRFRGVKHICVPDRSTKSPDRADASKRSVGSATTRNDASDVRSHQRDQEETWTHSLPLQGRKWNEPLGRARCDLRQSHQHRSGNTQKISVVISLSTYIRFLATPRAPLGEIVSFVRHCRQRPSVSLFAKTPICAGRSL